MLKRTNLLRTAALCMALCAVPLSMRAEDNLADLLSVIKAKQAELKELVTANISKEQLQAFYDRIGESVVKLWTFKNRYHMTGNITQSDIDAITTIIESIDIEQLKLIAQASSVVDNDGAKNALDTLQYFVDACKSDICAYYAQVARKAARDKFIADLSSWTSYTAAWDALCTTEGLQEKATTLWNNHKPAVAGAAIVTVVTAATITACIVYRNKIKAGWNKLFGSSTQA